jgi:lipopolysaccharide transport system permease protein
VGDPSQWRPPLASAARIRNLLRLPRDRVGRTTARMLLARHHDAATFRTGALSHLGSILRFPVLVWANRYMVQNFLRRDLMSRVHGSMLGVWWILLQPLFLFAIYYVVFGYFLGKAADPSEAFAVYLFSGVIVFHSLTEATGQSCNIIVDNGNLVKKVAFPAEVLLVHVALVSMVIYLVGAVVLFFGAWLSGASQPGWLLLAMPLVMLVQFTLTLGLGLLLSNLHVFLRDTAQLWRLVTMAWMFLSPVFWSVKDLQGDGTTPPKVPLVVLEWMQMLNPAWPLIQAQRLALGAQGEQFGSFWPQLGMAAAWAVGLLLIGYSVFMSRKHKFSDLI